ncbi:MAG: serpin family protein [Candidatus Eisenbacteria bacterium]
MRWSRALIILFALAAFVLTPLVCNGQESENPAADAMRELTSGNSGFALDLYQALKNKPGNLFLSPYSISSALALTYGGTRGNTATQMAEALHFTLEDRYLQEAFGSLNEDLNGRGSSGDIELGMANALWGQKDEGFLDDFVSLGRKYYGAELKSVDFAGSPGSALDEINAWASDKTRGKITNLIEPGMIDQATMLVLSNAIYFNGGWASKFDGKKTWEEPFWVAPDSSVMVDMMHQTRRFRYTETSELQILDLPYVGGDLSMIVLLPKDRTGLAGAERFLTLKSLRIWLRQLREEDLIVSLPRFKVASDLLLNQALKDMGMTDAFDVGLADFSGMTGRKGLFIDAVVHKALLEVAEDGTEAAASTAVVTKRGPPPKQFRADHPFLFMIRDNKSGSILFIGRVADPTG